MSSVLDLLEEHIPDALSFRESLRRPLPTVIWANRLRIEGSDLRTMLSTIGVPSRASSWHPSVLILEPDVTLGRTFPYLAGLLHVQEEASIIAAALLAAQPGERVLDLCAAPGGKTAWTAVQMNNTGCVLANDLSGGRLIALRANLDRLGVINTAVMKSDARQRTYRAEFFDAVIADVPCSCTGTIRQNPSAAMIDTGPHLDFLVGTQRSILRTAIDACRPGGRILYATCSLLPEENECVLDAVLRERDDEVSLRPITLEGITFSPAIREWGGRLLDPRIEHARRLYPHMNDTGGFFFALIEKPSDN